MTERKYSEEEVARIFELATKAQSGGHRQIGAGDGMTLAGLQEIAKEIGLPPELVTQAARSLDAAGQQTSRSLLGLPIGVGQSADLGRKLTDAEWDRLVADLRETFDANGRIQADGTARQWRNSRLQVLVEPGDDGHRIRLKTYNGTAAAYIGIGAGMLATAGAVGASIAIAGGFSDQGKVIGVSFLAITGLLSFAWGALRLPSWARKRRNQFKEVIARLTSPRA